MNRDRIGRELTLRFDRGGRVREAEVVPSELPD
jgi:hypothetical protein